MTHHRVWKINEGLVRSLRPACSGGINKRTTPPPTIPKFDSLLVDPLLLWNVIIMPSFWWIFCCCWINLFLLILPSLGLIRQTKQCTTLSTYHRPHSPSLTTTCLLPAFYLPSTCLLPAFYLPSTCLLPAYYLLVDDTFHKSIVTQSLFLLSYHCIGKHMSSLLQKVPLHNSTRDDRRLRS